MLVLSIAISSCTKTGKMKASAPRGDGGVAVNGVIWATQNVGVKGEFMDTPWSYGLYYTFEEVQDACPEGWRLPTRQEFDVLVQTESKWITVCVDEQEFVAGRVFGEGNNIVFFPAAGYYNQEESPNHEGDINRGTAATIGRLRSPLTRTGTVCCSTGPKWDIYSVRVPMTAAASVASARTGAVTFLRRSSCVRPSADYFVVLTARRVQNYESSHIVKNGYIFA